MTRFKQLLLTIAVFLLPASLYAGETITYAGAGGSAGGHLAAFTALVSGLDDPADDLKVSCRPDALVLFNPVFNNGPGEWGHERVAGRYRDFSPAHHVAAGAPPAIVFVGDADALLPVRVVKDFEAAMTKAGVRCESRVYPKAAHGFFYKAPHLNVTMIETDKFLTSLDWLKGEPSAKPVEGSIADRE